MAYTPGSGAVISFAVDGVANARRQIDGIGVSMNDLSDVVTKSVGKIAAFAGVGLSIGELSHQVLGAQREFDKLDASLITAVGSVGDAKQAFAALQSFAATTPYSVKEATDSFIKMRNLGLDPSEKALRSYGNTAAAMGKGLDQMIEAVADAATGEFERLKEFGIKAKQNGDQVSLTFQGVTTTIANNAKSIEGYLQKLGETNFAGGMELRAATLDGAISNLGDTWDTVMRGISENGAGEAMGAGVSAATDALTDLKAILDAVGGAAEKEGKAVSDASGLHVAITTIFEAVAVLGVNVAYVFRQVGNEIGGLAAQAAAVAHGDFAGAKRIGEMMVADAERDRKEVDAKTAAILGAAEKAKKAAADAAAAKEAAGRDDLARFRTTQQAAAASADAMKKAAAEREKEAALLAQLSGVTSDYMEQLTRLQKLRVSQNMSDERYIELVTELINKQPGVKAGLEAQAKAIAQVAALNKQYYEGLSATSRLLDDQIVNAIKEADANEELAHTFGMSKAAIAELELARLEDQLAQRTSLGLTLNEIETLEKLTDAKKRSVAAINEIEAKEANKKAADDLAAEYKRASEQIGQSLTDNIMRGGKSSAEYLKDLFRTLVLRPIIAPIGNAIGAAFTGYSGANPAGGAGSNLATAGSLFSVGKTVFSGMSSGVSGTMGGMVSNLGGMFGSSAMSAYGAGMASPGSAAIMSELAQGTAGGSVNAVAASSASSGASMGYAIPIAGWIAAGMALSHSLYGQGWDARNGTMEDPLKLSGGSAIFDGILRGIGLSDSTANIFSGMSTYARLFGRKNPEIESRGLQGTVSAGGFDGKLYANIVEKGGLFRSDKRYEKTADLSVAQDAEFDTAIKSMLLAVKGFGAAIGVETAQIDGYSKAIKLQLTDDEAKNQQLVAQLFGEIGDELSNRLVPDLAKFTHNGETASATLQRLAEDFQATDQIAQLLGKSASSVFGAGGMESAAAREQLIALAGGVQALGQQASFYAQNFLTEAERLKPVQEALEAEMAKLGLASIKGREAFKAHIDQLVSSGAVLTETGAKEFAALMNLEQAYALVYPAMEQTTAALREQQQAMRDQASALLGGVDSAFSVLEAAVNREKAALQERIDAETALVDKLKAGADALHGTLDSMRPVGQGAAERAGAQAEIAQALATMKAGGALPDADSLKRALSAVSQSDPRQFSSYQAYLTDFYRTRNQVAELSKLTDGRLSVEEKSLAGLQNQSRQLDQMLAREKEQIDALKGIDTRGLSIVQALEGLRGALLAARSNPLVAGTAAINQAYMSSLGRAPDAAGLQWWQNVAANGTPIADITAGIANSTEAKLRQLYQSALGRAPDAAGLSFWMNAFGPTMDAGEIDSFMQGAAPELQAKANGTWDEFLRTRGVPSFDVGTNYIAEDTLAQVHAGERIMPPADNRELMRRLASPASNNDVLAGEVRRLREKAERQERLLSDIAVSVKRQADLFSGADGGGFLRMKVVGSK